ncbi:TerD family protein [Tsukamurella soli]|uniref:TerD family protein n=1 Tax=Tsukamurella soli TaxID=644556 RepID=UPI00361A52F8
MTTMRRGENRPAPAGDLAVAVECAAALDLSALLLTAEGRVRSDADLVFYNNRSGPGVDLIADVVHVRPDEVPAEVHTIAVAASIDGDGTFGSIGPITAQVDGPGASVRFPVEGLTSETALIVAEVYRWNGMWKIRAVGQGYDTGLAGVVTAFGVDVDDTPAAACPVAPAPAHTPTPAPARGGGKQDDGPSPRESGAEPRLPSRRVRALLRTWPVRS